MKRSLPLPAVLLAACAMLACGVAGAQGRGAAAQDMRGRQNADGAQARSRKVAELDTWLRRLSGEFRYTGTFTNGDWYSTPCRAVQRARPGTKCTEPSQPVKSQDIEGSWRCSGVGASAGLRCEIDVADGHSWIPVWDPAASLFGVNPDAAGIHYLHVDNEGRADIALGVLEGDTATFQLFCPKSVGGVRVTECRRVMKITAPREGKVIRVSVTMDMRFGSLRGAVVISAPVVAQFELERLP